MPKVFLSHSHPDKPFVRQLAADLGAMGVRVWLDEAEIKVGESLIDKISTAIDDVEYLAVILSPHSVSSRWVREELEQALGLQIAGRRLTVLPILLQDCQIPGFLRGKKWADFRDRAAYDASLELLLRSIGVDTAHAAGASLFDPFAERYGRIDGLYARPKEWFCIFCGWHCQQSYNDYVCNGCQRYRPFAGGGSTMVGCPRCQQWSLAIATYCEWCGARIAVEQDGGTG